MMIIVEGVISVDLTRAVELIAVLGAVDTVVVVELTRDVMLIGAGGVIKTEKSRWGGISQRGLLK